MKTAILEPKQKQHNLEQEQDLQNSSEGEAKNPFLEEEENEQILDDNPFDPQDLENLSSSADSEPSISEETEEEQKHPLSQRFNPVFLTQVAAVLVVVFGCVYTVTRPCVMGECQEVDAARELSQRSKQTIETVSSAQAPIIAQQDLQSGIKLLKTIPFWSPHYPEAKALLSIYQKESNEFNAVVKALKTAAQASAVSQNPPHPIEDWVKMQSLWEEAIALLEQVPSESIVYPFAQARWQQYRGNLAEVRGRLKLERDGEQILTTAKKAAQVAEARQGVAKYAESWQQVFETWQTAANTLSTIPYGTTAYQSAQVLLARYQPKLEQARDRKTIEQVGLDAYNQAVNNAEQAKLLEQRGAWSEAVTYWSRAVSYGKQVPASSSYAAKIKPLLTTYNDSWKRADVQNRVASRLTKARQDLSKLCSGNPKVCNYSINENVITVRLTSDYVNQIQSTAKTADQTGDSKKRSEAENHVQVLTVALETISQNAQIPLEVYGANNEKMATHIPLP
ncbi:hypothetical protein [Planktothrix mougeotii]|uniref:Chromosome segregation ATPase n=1 Tax=Planktothrix mougeotii LEGE 06226 TaxID=1828728 RepID=A0ABR9UBJ2_9CYAN|nr:hypothetical protein [Planktothrix mougeotii]MBE9143825.1 hypothetical protein [Planktothrix mougeotii LEGE 06226]